MKGFTCIEDKCDFKNDCPIIKHFYDKGRAYGAREFAEWLVDKGILGNRCIYNGEITDYGKVYLAEWQKGEE